LRRNRDFRLLYIAAIISLAGDWFLTVALLDLVLERTGRAALATLVTVTMNLPVFLATPWVSRHVDRMDRRKLMITMDLVRTGAALLPLLATTPERLPLAYVGVMIISLGTAYFDPAADAALPNLVAPEDLGRANALLGGAWGSMMAAGAAIGGLVTTYFGRTTSFVVNSASFFVSALLLLLIRTPFSAADTLAGAKSSEENAGLGEALRYARERPRVLALLAGKGGYGLATGVVALLSVLGSRGLGAGAGHADGPGGARGIAVLLAARGIGALLGPFALRSVVSGGERLNLSIAPCIALFGVAYIGLSQSSNLWFGAACVLLAHMGGSGQWMASLYGLQREVPDRLRGRIFAIDYGLVTLAVSLSSLLSGLLADRYGATPVVVGISAFAVVWATGWLLLTFRLWKL
jgi:MFS family permease